MPAAHVPADVQLEHGAKPVDDHVLPLTHAGTATQASAVAFHAKLAAQPQLLWPTRLEDA